MNTQRKIFNDTLKTRNYELKCTQTKTRKNRNKLYNTYKDMMTEF